VVELGPRDCIIIPAAHIFRWVTTEEIAEAVALLVSDRGKFIADVIYRVDGGMTGA
jgi:NAD(P)-dependent dehydrogenase (short-subunit alcohol dehydrogenase family)